VFTFQTDNLNINMALNGGKEHMHMEKQSHTDTKYLEKSGLSTRVIHCSHLELPSALMTHTRPMADQILRKPLTI